MGINKVSHHIDAFGRVEVNHSDAVFTQSIDTAGKIDRFSNDYGAYVELTYQAAAIPARRKGSDQNFVAVGFKAAGLAKGIRFAMA